MRRQLFSSALIFRIVFSLLAFITLSVSLVYGASITVNASCSLPNAIAAANTDTVTGGCPAGSAGSDTITITQAGTTNGTITLSAEIEVNGTSSQESIIVIVGGGYTVSGNDSVRIFRVKEHGNLSISNLTITNGSADSGGALRVDSDGVLTLNSVVVKNSESTSGNGGGIRNSGSLIIRNSVIHDNFTSGYGGGIAIESTALISNTVIRDNTAHGSADGGGGVFIEGSSSDVQIDKSSIYSNTAYNSYGGALHVKHASRVLVTNTSIYDNRAFDHGAIVVANGTVTFTHVTVVNNRATISGTRITGGSVNLVNSIIAGTTTDGSTRSRDCEGSLALNVSNLIGNGYCSPDYTGDPGLASSTQGSPPYYPLLANSQAIGKGDDTYCAQTGSDQRGAPRPATTCDLGAYEYTASFFSRSASQSQAGSSDLHSSSAASTPGPSTGEILANDGYQLQATYGLASGVQFQRLDESGVGNQSIVDLGVIDAIDVWSYVDQGVEVCFPQSGYVIFLDASTSPRTVIAIDSYLRDNYTCVTLNTAGTVVLTENPLVATQVLAQAMPGHALENCMVTTTASVNFRDAPAGGLLGNGIAEGATLTALSRTSDWFEVDYHGVQGWISADYVTTAGTCG